MGNGTSELSINNKGNLLGPYYYNGDFISVSDRWRNLTYDNIALNSRVGIGVTNPGDDGPIYNKSGSRVVDPIMSGQQFETSGFIATSGNKGYGTITVSGTITVGGALLELNNTYTLGQNDSFLKITTTLKNISSSTVSNVRFWVGTRDDNIGGEDEPTKTRGNLVGGAFQAITGKVSPSTAIKITSGTEGVLFLLTTLEEKLRLHVMMVVALLS